ncbi:unnamed protein product, partial [Rotaria magnacalcarata]
SYRSVRNDYYRCDQTDTLYIYARVDEC